MSDDSQPLRLHLLGPAIAVIVAATMVPTGLRHPSFIYVDFQFLPGDIINNILLYLPLGFALGGTSLRRAFLYGLCLSTLAETLQLGFVDRSPSVVDIATNTIGAVLGYVAARYLSRITGRRLSLLKIPRVWGLAAIPLAILGTGMMLVRHPQPDFSNWTPACRLLVGNEVTGDRPWAGVIRSAQIYPFALDAAQLADLAKGAAETSQAPAAWPGGGLLPATNWSAGNSQPVLSSEQEQALFQALVKQSRMTLLVSMEPENVQQRGPARIITYSQSAFSRNFTLGQVGDVLTFRLRTPMTGPNGTEPALFTKPILKAHQPTLVAAVYDGRTSSLYVDGQLTTHADLALKRPHLPMHVLRLLPHSVPTRVIELGAAEMLSSSLLALGLFALRGVPRSAGARVSIGLFAGLVVGLTIWGFAVSSRGLGMRILLECVAASLVMAASVAREPITKIQSQFQMQP